MALRFNTSEQALYDAAKNIAEIEIRRIGTPSGTIDPVMRHTHDRIRDTLNAHTAPREWLAVAIGTAEGQLTGMDTPNELAIDLARELRMQMEALPEEVVVPPVVPVVPPTNPVPPARNTPAQQPAVPPVIDTPQVPPLPENEPIIVQNPEPSTLPATVVPNFPNPEYNPAAYRTGISSGGMRKLFLDRYMYRFSREPVVTPPATPA